MGKMTPEKAAKMLAEDGIVLTNDEAIQIVEFLRSMAKMAVAQYLREGEYPPRPDTENNHQNQL
jgi:hypothetical protein